MKNKSLIKKVLIFAGALIICYLFGFVLGRMVSDNDNQKIFEMLKEFIKNYSVYFFAPLFIIANAAGLIYQLIMLKKGKQMAALADTDTDDDTAFDKAGKQLEKPINLSNYILIFNCIVFSILIESVVFAKGLNKTFELIVAIGGSSLFIAMYIVQFIIVRHSIELVKKLCPEKQGDLLDMNFQRKWLSSFDEGEKYMAYRCGFNAYKNASTACLIMWVICFGLQFIFNTGVMPVIAVGIIWAVLAVSYARENRRLDGGNTETEEKEEQE